MPSRLAVVFWLDAGLFLSFCALESVPFTGMILHEWLGIALIVMIVTHLLFSWSWIAALPRSNRSRFNYLLNLALFAIVTAVIFSGLLISQEAIPSITGRKAAAVDSDFAWTHVHNVFANFVFILAGLHLAINWKWTRAAMRKLLRRKQGQA